MQNIENFSPACERNKASIEKQLNRYLSDCKSVIEIGSGSGQHAMYFASKHAQLRWYTTEMSNNLMSLSTNLVRANATNVESPLLLDVSNKDHWPNQTFDLVYTANTLHIMSWQHVQCLFSSLSQICHANTVLAIYGPFKYDGQFTSESNGEFDKKLRQRDGYSGIRNQEEVNELAKQAGFTLREDYEMPANNQLLIWQYQGNKHESL